MTEQTQTKLNLDTLYDAVVAKRKIYEEKKAMLKEAERIASEAHSNLVIATEAFRNAIRETGI